MKISKKTVFLTALITFFVTLLAFSIALFIIMGGADGSRFLLKMNSVRNIITSHYVGDYDLDAIGDDCASAAVNSLGDRWSKYYSAEDYVDYQSYQANTTKGIGVTVTTDEATGGFLVNSVTLESPAETAGIEKGDIIIEAAGVNVCGKDVSELRSILTAQEEEYDITVLREEKELTLQIMTGEIYEDPVSYTMLDDNVGYIRIRNFHEGSADSAIAAIKDLTEQNAQSLIFDVRTDPGGYVDELKKLLDYILPEGTIFISVSEDGEEKITTSDASCISLPMAVLIDENSYSAAELFAAALSEYGVAQIVGTPSTGKDRSQQTYELFDDSAVHISTACYLTPVKRIDLAEQGGLQPDVYADGSEEYGSPVDAAWELLAENEAS